tara:strand:+ start:134 stop:607 length:474 start_codon:yes stop_codon:yes gene_type:complete
MPTGTNKSPLTIDPATAAMLAEYSLGDIKAAQKSAKEAMADEMAVGTNKGEGIARSVAASQLGRVDYGLGLLGMETDLSGLVSSKKAKQLQKLREYKPVTNINPITGEEMDSALTMTGKTKALTSIQGTIPYNKSANEHKSGLTMNKIAMSGISSKY